MIDLSVPYIWNKRTLLGALLLPLSWLYLFLHHMKFTYSPCWVAPRPVICIGNLMLGGSGKTPLVLSIAHKLKDQHINVAILTRGYRGRITKATQVDSEYHSARDVGDEALMMAQYFPCFIGSNKVEIAKMAIRQGAEILLMDDGLQNHSLYQNLRIVVIDGQIGFGNRWIFPAGPLREPVSALKRASLVVMIGEDKDHIFHKIKRQGVEILRARTVPEQMAKNDKGWLAFAGIGYPQKFFNHLSLIGFDVKRIRAFPNHHMMTHREMMALFREAKQHDLRLITTEKDWVRIPKLFRHQIHCHRIGMVWEQEEEITKRLANFIYFTDCIV